MGTNTVGMSIPRRPLRAEIKSEARDRSPIKHFFVWQGITLPGANFTGDYQVLNIGVFIDSMKRSSVHFFVAITVHSLFILCLLFLDGEEKKEKERNGDKKCTQFGFIHRFLWNIIPEMITIIIKNIQNSM